MAAIKIFQERQKQGVNHRLRPEIWKVYIHNSDDFFYVIADTFSESLIRNNEIKRIEEILKVRLIPMSSEGFRERIKVSY
jgi:hypothetical protein